MLEIQQNKALSDLTTFKIGGKAQYFVEVKNEAEIRDALGWARERDEPFTVLAGGSNVLIPDVGLEGLVIHITADRFAFINSTLEADAGCNLLSLIRASAELGLGGWEKLAGIPGTIGGAVRGNAGAFGPEMKDFLLWAHAINTKTEEVHEFSNAECDFSYRNSFFKKNPDWIVTKVHIALENVESSKTRQGPALPRSSQELIEATIAEREKRHIQDVRAAGSFFMNPIAPAHVVAQFEEEKKTESRGGRVPAGWLIEKAGMKGATVGGAESSRMHPNYLVNAHEAKSSEVLELAAKIKAAVHEKFGITLEEEAVILTSK